MMKAAIAPENLFWTPSSCSIISSARFSASSLIEASGWWMRATSSLICLIRVQDRNPLRSWTRIRSIEVDAFFGEVLHRARMPWHGRGVLLLVLELDVLGFLVRA